MGTDITYVTRENIDTKQYGRYIASTLVEIFAGDFTFGDYTIWATYGAKTTWKTYAMKTFGVTAVVACVAISHDLKNRVY